MGQPEDNEEFYDAQRKQNQKSCTHFLVDMSENGKNECYSYYIFETKQMNDGTEVTRPKYLDCWGGFSGHVQQDYKEVQKRLQPYNYERDGDYPKYTINVKETPC